MEASFWHDTWATQQIGFHLDRPNPILVRHAALLGAKSRVLVPLCGKSHDLAWLAERGHEVVGVELSELAARAFFDEHELSPTESTLGPYKRFSSGAVQILCGDFFALERAHLGGSLSAVYDRAALVALPPPMRERYAKHLSELMPPRTPALLVTLEHTGSGEAGPPFSVTSAEVRARYEADFTVTELERNDILESEPRFKARGFHTLHEVAHSLIKR